MKLPSFLYSKPASVAAACAALADMDGAQILAGGQSLMPAMSMRLACPTGLIDINDIPELHGLELTGNVLRIGAAERHADVERSDDVRKHFSIISRALQYVAHSSVRNRGTHCGSLALAHPSAEMPACAVLLDAKIVLASTTGVREIPARDFFLGPYETAREAAELITEARYSVPQDDLCYGFAELAPRHGDFALVGVAMSFRKNGDCIADLSIVVFGSEPTPRLCNVSDVAERRPFTTQLRLDVARAVADMIDPLERPALRRHQTAALVERILQEAWHRG